MQRVSTASVSVDGEAVGRIGAGLLVLLGVAHGDDEATADRMAAKIAALRIFAGDDRKMREAVGDQDGRAILVVSQFTLLADLRKGNRPSFTGAAEPGLAERLYERVADALDAQRGVFGAHMEVTSVNDGPVTIVLDLESSHPHAS